MALRSSPRKVSKFCVDMIKTPFITKAIIKINILNILIIPDEDEFVKHKIKKIIKINIHIILAASPYPAISLCRPSFVLPVYTFQSNFIPPTNPEQKNEKQRLKGKVLL